jgi:glutamine amidotransferase
MENFINKAKPIGIIDYGSGNLQSIINALNYLKIPTKILNNPKELKFFDKVILPGVGSFANAMRNLNQKLFSKSIIELIELKKIKLLGICLGMQLLYEHSEEDDGCEGLGIVQGKVEKIVFKKGIRTPNVGWRKIEILQNSTLLQDIEIDPIFYFAHSFGCKTYNKGSAVGVLNYGQNFDVVIDSENVFGTQFHPEKSQIIGLKVLKNFSTIS